MKCTLITAFFIAVAGSICPATAQTYDPIREMEDALKQMRAWQQQMLEQGLGRSFGSPQGDSSFFYFHIDTTFSGDGAFRFSPFGNDGLGDSFFFDGDSFFRQFFEQSPFEDFFRSPDPNADDGNLRQNDDGLLPEERLRQQESQKPKSPPKPSDRQVIRI